MKKTVLLMMVVMLCIGALTLLGCTDEPEAVELESVEEVLEEANIEEEVVEIGPEIEIESMGDDWADEKIANLIATAQANGLDSDGLTISMSFRSATTTFDGGDVLNPGMSIVNLTKYGNEELAEFQMNPSRRRFTTDEAEIITHDDGFIRQDLVYYPHGQKFGKIQFGQYVFEFDGDVYPVDAFIEKMGYLTMSEIPETPFADLRSNVESMDSSIGKMCLDSSSTEIAFSMNHPSSENQINVQILIWGTEEAAIWWRELFADLDNALPIGTTGDFAYRRGIFQETLYGVQIYDRNIELSISGLESDSQLIDRLIVELGYEF